MSLERHVILTGFMGAGKSTVGKEVSRRLGVPLYDNDARVASRAGMAIPDIFNRYKEEGFRRRERIALLEILGAKRPGVVSTGGGIVSTEAGRQILTECGMPVIFLDAEFDTLAARVEADTSNVRPLFLNIGQARGLHALRMPWYEETANAIVDTNNRPLELVISHVITHALIHRD